MAELLDGGADDGRGIGSPSSGFFQVVVLRPGTPTGPLIVLTPAWDDVFGYQDLALEFAEDVRVLALAYVEQPGQRLVTTVDELVTSFLPQVGDLVQSTRRTAIVGWSVGGVVAAELSQRMRDIGEGVDAVALVDTFFPGEHRHLWSNRWWKYRSLLAPSALPEAVREIRVMMGSRVRRWVGSIGRGLMVWSGAEVPPQPERTSVGGFPVDALDHPIAEVATPLIFYSATTTNPQRTTRRWHTIAADMEIVPVRGRHRGYDSIMEPPRVGAIAADLERRLRS